MGEEGRGRERDGGRPSGGGRYSRIGVQTILKRPFPLGAPYHIHGCSNTNSEETIS